jgi:hypothetical protein
MTTNRADVERIVEGVLSQLRLNVYSGGFTDPNSRKVELTLGGKVISTAYFDVVQMGEYKG